MQYKIPVQIENDDPILLGLSLKQLGIIMVGFGIAYGIFTSLAESAGKEIAAIPAVIIVLLTLGIALFKKDEMTFVPYILAFLRFHINYPKRAWAQKVDAYSGLEIGIITQGEEKKEKQVKVSSQYEKMQTLEESLKNI